LRERIEKRTEEMLNAGWVEEAESAIKNGLLQSPTAHQALGYKIIAEYLNGEMDFNALKEKIAVSTWQFARRQITWFKSKHPESEKIQMPMAYDELRAKFRSSQER
jgi:tRNA dimethylallyltransferase